MKSNLLVLIALIISGVLGFSLSLYRDRESPSVITDDVKVIKTFHYPALFAKQLQGDPQAGKKIFKEFCSACHASQPLIDISAPRINDEKTWKAINTIGMKTLLQTTINGVGAMPARGGCFECSDQQLQQAIQYILDESIPH